MPYYHHATLAARIAVEAGMIGMAEGWLTGGVSDFKMGFLNSDLDQMHVQAAASDTSQAVQVAITLR